MNPPAVPEAYYKQMHDLQAVDFVLIELTLYLDTHPNDMAAIQQYNQFAQKRKQMVQQFELEFGPLMAYGHAYSKHPWEWIEPPWPWQV